MYYKSLEMFKYGSDILFRKIWDSIGIWSSYIHDL